MIGFDDYIERLKSQAAFLKPTQTYHIGYSWPPSSTKDVIPVTLVELDRKKCHSRENIFQMSYVGKSDDICVKRAPIKLEDMFNRCDHNHRRIVLIEGVQGSGKTALSLSIVQRWGRGELFKQFKAVIYVPLHDESTRKSSYIEELFPSKGQIEQQVITDLVRECDGQYLLFILDGWDDLPVSMQQNSFFTKLIGSSGVLTETPLRKSSVIITSRPISSYTLYSFVSLNIMILGFSDNTLKIFFSKSFKADTKAVALFEKIKKYPELANSYHLPLNASILVHIYNCTTETDLISRYDIFNELILSYIYHHFLKKERRLPNSDSFNDLPDDVFPHFMKLSKMAFEALDDGRTIFSSEDIDSDHLGLLQGYSERDDTLSFKFTYHAFQELMAAYYISKQPHEDQLYCFNKLLYDRRFIPVLQFYATITKLEGPSLTDVILNIIRDDDRDRLLHALYCLREIPHSAAFKRVSHELRVSGLILGDSSSFKSLTSEDCQCVGIFLSHSSSIGEEITEIDVSMNNCSIDDDSCCSLVQGLLSGGVKPKMNLVLSLSFNNINDKGAESLSHIIRHGNLRLSQLNLSKNYSLSNSGASYIAEGLRYHSLNKLTLSCCGLTPEFAKMIEELLRKNTSLLSLDISSNEILDDGAFSIAKALEENQTLTELYLDSCGIQTKGLEYLFSSLRVNSSLKFLSVANSIGFPMIDNNITKESLLSALATLPENAALEVVRVALEPQVTMKIQTSVNSMYDFVKLHIQCKSVT